jgi:hypothetical protein
VLGGRQGARGRHSKNQLPENTVEGLDQIHEEQEDAPLPHVRDLNDALHDVVREVGTTLNDAAVLRSWHLLIVLGVDVLLDLREEALARVVG